MLIRFHVVWDGAHRKNGRIHLNSQFLENAAHLVVQPHHLSCFPPRHVIRPEISVTVYTLAIPSISSVANICGVAAAAKLKIPVCQWDWIRVNTRSKLSPMIKWTAPSGTRGCVKDSTQAALWTQSLLSICAVLQSILLCLWYLSSVFFV